MAWLLMLAVNDEGGERDRGGAGGIDGAGSSE